MLYTFSTAKSQGTSTNTNVTIKVEGGIINSTVVKTFTAVSITQGQSLYDALVALRDSSDFTYVHVYMAWSNCTMYMH